MFGWRIAKFEDVCVVSCPSKMERTSPDLNHVFNSKVTRKSFKCFKKIKISGGCNATVLDITRLYALITETVKNMEKIVKKRPRWYQTKLRCELRFFSRWRKSCWLSRNRIMQSDQYGGETEAVLEGR